MTSLGLGVSSDCGINQEFLQNNSISGLCRLLSEQVVLPELLIMKRMIRMALFSMCGLQWSLCSGAKAALARSGHDTGEVACSCSFYLPLVLSSSCTFHWGQDLTVYFLKYVENKLSTSFIAASCNSFFSRKGKMGRWDNRLLHPNLQHSGNCIFKRDDKGVMHKFCVWGHNIFFFIIWSSVCDLS